MSTRPCQSIILSLERGIFCFSIMTFLFQLYHVFQISVPEYPIILPSQVRSFKPKLWWATIDECITWTFNGLVWRLVLLLRKGKRAGKREAINRFCPKHSTFLFKFVQLRHRTIPGNWIFMVFTSFPNISYHMATFCNARMVKLEFCF